MKIKGRIGLIIIAMMALLVPNKVAYADSALGSSLVLSETQGTVEIENMNGVDVPVLSNMKLYNGYQVTTETSSYAWVTLDDARVIKQDAVSEVEIRKKGKNLEVLLQSGNLFFDVAEPLSDNENLNIHTSTMTMGIRGTAGWVRELNADEIEVALLEGKATITTINYMTGEQQSTTIQGNQIVTINHNGEITTISVREISDELVPGFVAVEVEDNPELTERIETLAPDVPVEEIIAGAEERLAADESEKNAAVELVNEQIRELDAASVMNPEWEGSETLENGSKRFPVEVEEEDDEEVVDEEEEEPQEETPTTTATLADLLILIPDTTTITIPDTTTTITPEDSTTTTADTSTTTSDSSSSTSDPSSSTSDPSSSTSDPSSSTTYTSIVTVTKDGVEVSPDGDNHYTLAGAGTYAITANTGYNLYGESFWDESATGYTFNSSRNNTISFTLSDSFQSTVEQYPSYAVLDADGVETGDTKDVTIILTVEG